MEDSLSGAGALFDCRAFLTVYLATIRCIDRSCLRVASDNPSSETIQVVVYSRMPGDPKGIVDRPDLSNHLIG